MNSKKYLDTSTKTTLLAQIIFITVIAGTILVFEYFFNKTPSEIKNNEATVLLDFDDMKRMFVGEVAEQMTILDALNAAVTAGKIKLNYTIDNSDGTKLAEINDHTIEANKTFQFYLNKKKIDATKINRTYIRPGDKVTIKLE